MNNSGIEKRYFLFGDYTLDAVNRELLKGDEKIQLTQKCFEMLYFLVRNTGRTISKEEILQSVWRENFVEEANLSQHIYMIRRAFKKAGDQHKYIETVPKYGYRFTEAVTSENTLPETQEAETPVTAVPLLSSKTDPPINESRKRPLSLKSVTTGIAIGATLVLLILSFFYISRGYQDASTGLDRYTFEVRQFEDVSGYEDPVFISGLSHSVATALSDHPLIDLKKISSEVGNNGSAQTKLQPRVLECSYIRSRGTVKVHARLYEGVSRRLLWDEKFAIPTNELHTLANQITASTLTAMNLKSIVKNPDNVSPEGTDWFTAYTIALGLIERNTPDETKRAMQYLEVSIRENPDFAAAHALLSDIYSVNAYNKVPEFPEESSFERGSQLANRAIELHPQTSEAYSALAIIALHKRKLDDAINLFQRSLSIRPDNARARQRLAWLLSANGQLQLAIGHMRIAVSSNPESPHLNISLARMLRLNRDTDEALAYCHKAVELEPKGHSHRVVLAEIYEQKGQFKKSKEQLRSVPDNRPSSNAAKLVLGRVYAKTGETEKALDILKSVVNTKVEREAPYEVATIYAHLGERTKAVEELKRGKNNSLMHFLHLKYDYNIDTIRNEPAYPKILTKSRRRIESNDS